MTNHTCRKCKRVFKKKYDLERHLARKKPCNRKGDENLKCEICNEYFSRIDSLERHVLNLHSEQNASDTTINETNIDNSEVNKDNKINNKSNNKTTITTTTTTTTNSHNNNNNNVTIKNNNNFFLAPFKEYSFDDLTMDEKIAIFSSKHNPIEMIIFKTHLNPDKIQYHNCGIPDMHSGFGLIFDGKRWENWRISDILTTLIEINQKNTSKLYEEIKDFLMDDAKKTIEHDLENNEHLIRPRNSCYEIDVKAKKNLISMLKGKFYDERHLLKKSIERTKDMVFSESDDDDSKNFVNIIKEGYTIQDIEDHLKKSKKNLNLCREMCKYILDLIENVDEIDKKLITMLIENSDIETINVIADIVMRCHLFGTELNPTMVTNKIKLHKKMSDLFI